MPNLSATVSTMVDFPVPFPPTGNVADRSMSDLVAANRRTEGTEGTVPTTRHVGAQSVTMTRSMFTWRQY
ncbi:MAG: hypothetical protein ACRDYB_01060 [Acidimicrobiales bacterium]